MARTAAGCVVFADFADASAPGARPVRVPLAADSPLLREWAVVVRSADFSVVLTGWEVPDADPSGERRFETIFSFEPEAVRVGRRHLPGRGPVGRGPRGGPAARPAMPSTVDPPRTSSPGVDRSVLRAFDYLQSPRPPA